MVFDKSRDDFVSNLETNLSIKATKFVVEAEVKCWWPHHLRNVCFFKAQNLTEEIWIFISPKSASLNHTAAL